MRGEPALYPSSPSDLHPSFPSRSRSLSSVSPWRRPENRPMPTAVLTTVLAAMFWVRGGLYCIRRHLSSCQRLLTSRGPPLRTMLVISRPPFLLLAHFIRPSLVCYCPRGLLPPRGCVPRALIQRSTYDGDFSPHYQFRYRANFPAPAI